MKKVLRQIRLLIVSWLVGVIVFVCPKDAVKTLEWVLKIPFED